MDRLFFITIFAFIGGVALGSLFPAGESFVLFYFLLFLGALLIAFHYVLRCSGKESIALPVAIFIIALGFGVLRIDIANLDKGSPFLDNRVDTNVILEGVVVDEPDKREGHVKLTVHFEEYDTKLLLITEHYPVFQYGDRISLEGIVVKPKNFVNEEDESLPPFNYVAYLAKDGIFYQMFYPSIEFIESKQANQIKYFLFSLKAKLLSNVSRILPEPHVSFLGGITLGTKQALGEELLDDFRRVGIIHVVVLSGYNITIIADAIGRVSSFLPPLFRFGVSSLVIGLFVLMAGAGATIVRAAIMAFLVLLARTTGRTHAILRTLCIAGFVMILWNPKILIFDPSFQLSFLATIGLIYIAPRIESFFGWMPTTFQLREFATATLATQLFVLPLLIFMMREVSLVSLLVNLLVLPFIPLTMFFGLLTAVFGFFGDAVAFLPGAFSYLLLSYELLVVDFFAGLPFASKTVSFFPLWLMFFVYFLYALLSYFFFDKRATSLTS